MYSLHIPLLKLLCIFKIHNNYKSTFLAVLMCLWCVLGQKSALLSTYRFTCSGYIEKGLFIFSFICLTINVVCAY
jgi:hypothetical protein